MPINALHGSISGITKKVQLIRIYQNRIQKDID
jgi:hypothetical protein